MANEILIKENEDKAQRLIKEKRYDEARNILEKNVRLGSSHRKTFKLLIDIFRKKDDYANLIKTLNIAIKKTSRKKGFRELKKVCILEKMLNDIKKCGP